MLFFGCLIFSVLGADLYRYNAWGEGVAAYNSGDCETATTAFTNVREFPALGLAERFSDIDNEQARRLTRECAEYTAALAPANSGNFGRAVASLITFKEDYPNSVLNRAARGQITAWVEAEGAATLADDALCPALEDGGGTETLEQLAEIHADLVLACATNAEEAEDYSTAIAFFRQFRNQFPDHPNFEAATEGLARVEVASASSLGAAEIAQPEASGTAAAGTALYIVTNDSPEAMQIILTGPETIIEDFGPCEECTKFETVPDDCPSLGETREISLPPGRYEVVVKATNDDEVTPYQGTWTFRDGSSYDDCYYIVTGGDEETTGPEFTIYDVQTGDCYNNPSEDELYELELVDCTAPHEYETFAAIEYDAGPDEPYPGEAVLDEFSEEYCLAEFASYVGTTYEKSALYYYYLPPSEQTWEDGDRLIVCTLFAQDANGDLVIREESARGSQE